MTLSLARSGELRRLLADLVGGGEWRLRSMTLGRGDRDKVIAERDGQRYFVKLMWPPGADATRAAAEVGLAPRVIASGQLADGRAVVDLSVSLPVRQSAYPRERAEVRLRDMHLVADELERSGWPDLGRAQVMLQRIREASDDLPDVPHALVPVHGDPQWANWMLTTDNQLCLVDWDHARLDDPVTDPARLAWWLFEAGRRRHTFIERCGIDVENSVTWQRAEWSVTAYIGHTALWVARQGRLARASEFLHWCEQLLDDGLIS